MNQTVQKDGKVIVLCNYRWVDPDGHVETCRHVAACEVCGQCSRLDGDHEHGHCTGHLGLSDSIRVPGQEQAKARNEIERKQREIRGQKRVREQRKKRADRRAEQR